MLKAKVIITRPEALQRELNDFFVQVGESLYELKDVKIVEISGRETKIMAIIIYDMINISMDLDELM